MRIRSIKPEFWRSKTIAAVSWDARLVLKGLESYVDDNGVGKDDLELIISDVFSRDHFRNPRETVARVSEAISEVVQAGLVVRYEADGEKLIYIDKWKDIQRVDKPNNGRYRRPDGTMEYSQPVNRDSYRNPREDVANPPEVLAPVTGEQGNRGTGEQGNRGADDELPPEPPHDPDADPPDVVVDAELVPMSIDANTTRPKPHPSSSAKTVVRQELGHAGYPRKTIDRLATQVDALVREGHPVTLIRQALRAWDQKPSGALPEWLPTVLGDVVKDNRAQSATNVTAFERKKAHNGAVFERLGDQPNNPELPA